MKKNISIQTLLITETDGETTRIVSAFLGEWQQQGTYHLLRYEEPENKGTTRLFVTPSYVDLHRKGQTSSTLRLRPKRTHAMNYQTPLGYLPLMCHTLHLTQLLSTYGGRIEAEYELLIHEKQFSLNKIRIEWFLCH